MISLVKNHFILLLTLINKKKSASGKNEGRILRLPSTSNITTLTLGTIKEKSRRKTYTLAEAINRSHSRDVMGLLYLCLLIGFTAWWVFLPEQIIWLPFSSLDADFVTIVKETFVDRICSYQDVGDRCLCDDNIHKITAEVFPKIENAIMPFDPLGIMKFGKRVETLSVMMAAFLVSLVAINGTTEMVFG